MSFLKDRDFGNAGENSFMSYLREKGVSCRIDNEKGYDIMEIIGGVTYEVKSDRWGLITGNICLELMSHVGLKNRGWLQYSTADVLAYLLYDKEGNEVRDIKTYNLHSLRSFVFWEILNRDWYKETVGVGKIVSASGNPNVRNLLLPLELVEPFLIKEEN